MPMCIVCVWLYPECVEKHHIMLARSFLILPQITHTYIPGVHF